MHRPIWLFSMDSDKFHAPPTTTAALTSYFRKYGASTGNTNIELVHFQGGEDIAPWLEKWRRDALPLVQKALQAGVQPLLGFSFYTWNAAEFLGLAGELKALAPEMQILAGGPHVQQAEDYLGIEPIDIIFLGEAEVSLQEFLDCSNPAHWHDIPGLAFLDGSRIVKTPKRPRNKNLDLFPSPLDVLELTDASGRPKYESLLAPGAVYGYFPVGRDENALRVFSADQSTELGRFDLPRQRSGNRYCIADFFSDVSADGRPTDVLPMQAVTMGEKASIVAQELFKGDRYSDYLYFHGLAVQMAEALAEWVHARIRQELGFADPAGMPLRDVLAQRYRGSRYSFGYPACPNVADSRQQLLWLDADRIGLTMDASDQLSPEQSTTALVALHSKARYFSA